MGDDNPEIGASSDSIQQGFEPLSTHTRALGVTMAIFVVIAGAMGWGLWVLLAHYLADPRAVDIPGSVAVVLPPSLAAPLAPMPRHNDLDWQDMVHQRQREDEKLRAIGCAIDPVTGEAMLPMAVSMSVQKRYANSDSKFVMTDAPLRFPPPIAPVRTGPAESLPLADVFPPVGSATGAEQLKKSIYRPATGPSDINNLPTQSGPADTQNNPQAVPHR